MQVTIRSTTVQTRVAEAELSEHEVHEAIAAYVITRKAKDFPLPGTPGVTWQVAINDRTGEASVTVRHEQQLSDTTS